jgi:superfamily II DNA or RNA helicase
VLGPTVRWLIDHGFLAEYRYVGPPKQADLSGLKVKMGDYIAAQVADAMDRNHITGDAESHYRQYFNGAPAIGFCATVAHARHVAEQYRAMGWRAAAVDGTTDPIEREHMLRAIGNGELNFLASCALIDEGTDLPNVQGCQILAPTNSLQRYLQRVGRTLRVKSDGSRAIILDHVGDAFDRHGLPDFKHRWTLEGKKRGSSMRAPGVRQCPKCYLAFKPAPKCPDCGYEFPASAGVSLGPEVRAGELAEVTGDWLKMGPLKDVLRSATTRDQIDAIRKARGYHPNWTNVQISLRAGFRNSDQQRQSGPGWRRHG